MALGERGDALWQASARRVDPHWRVGAPPKWVRNEKYPADGPADAGAGHALGTGCAWLWSCGGAGRPGVRRYLWRGVGSDNYRGDKTLAVRDDRGARDRALPDLCRGIVSGRFPFRSLDDPPRAPVVRDRDSFTPAASSWRSSGASAAEQRDQLASRDHSITSSASASSLSGIWRPSVFAVLRLMINSSFVSCWAGRSPGFSPLRMRPV